MHFEHSDKTEDYIRRVSRFMEDHIEPAVDIYLRQMDEAETRWQIPLLSKN